MKLLAPFHLIKDTKTVQRTKSDNLQDPIESSVVAVKPGRHPIGFHRDIESPYAHLPRNSFERRFPLIANISLPTKPLYFPKSKAWVRKSKAWVRSSEKTSGLYAELMKTFWPSGGTVLDPIAGVMGTGLPCIQTMRQCVLLEVEENCFELAKKILTDHASARLEAENSHTDFLQMLEDEGHFGSAGENPVSLHMEEKEGLINEGVIGAKTLRAGKVPASSEGLGKMKRKQSFVFPLISLTSQQESAKPNFMHLCEPKSTGPI